VDVLEVVALSGDRDADAEIDEHEERREPAHGGLLPIEAAVHTRRSRPLTYPT
jgi:hypothetical protein